VEEKKEMRPHEAGKGDPDAFAAIVRDNQRWLRGYFRSRLADWAFADDLAQDVFVTAFLKIRSFRGDSSVETWLCGIARNHLRNHLRKHREQALGGSEEMQALLEQSCDEWPGEEPVGRTLEALAACKERLPCLSRDLLDLRYVEGKSVREIARETGKGYSALTMQFHRLRDLLAECIAKELERGKA
jgi:RNA polymerase sigma-70 factor, ECF subfamily